MNALELRYAFHTLLLGKHGPEGIYTAVMLGPQDDGTVRMNVTTTDPMGVPRTYTVTIEEH